MSNLGIITKNEDPKRETLNNQNKKFTNFHRFCRFLLREREERERKNESERKFSSQRLEAINRSQTLEAINPSQSQSESVVKNVKPSWCWNKNKLEPMSLLISLIQL